MDSRWREAARVRPVSRRMRPVSRADEAAGTRRRALGGASRQGVYHGGEELSTTRAIKIGVIGGTGFGEALVTGTPETVTTEWGEASVTRADLGDGAGAGRELLFLARHGAGHFLPPHRINHRANIAALRALGADAVFATAAAGSLRESIAPGDAVILDDFLDLTKGGVTTFFDAPGLVRHTDFVHPYDPALRALLQETAPASGLAVHPRGTYLCVSGPRYETPAEVRLFASWGADVVGMTGAFEAILCREAGLPYAGVALATNYGTGLLPGVALSHADVEATMAARRAALAAWLLRAARAVPMPKTLGAGS